MDHTVARRRSCAQRFQSLYACERGAQNRRLPLTAASKVSTGVARGVHRASLTRQALMLAPGHTVDGRMDDNWMVGAAVMI